MNTFLDNAGRHSPPYGLVEVVLRGGTLSVRDHGPGVPEDEAARIFERFYRADTSRTRETGGSGLGLAIVAAIVGSHSGTVRADKTDGGGATLVVSLPYLDEVFADEALADDSMADDTAVGGDAVDPAAVGEGAGAEDAVGEGKAGAAHDSADR